MESTDPTAENGVGQTIDEGAYACPWDNCRETFPRAGGDHPDALLLTSHAYAVHNGHIGSPESCVIEDSQ